MSFHAELSGFRVFISACINTIGTNGPSKKVPANHMLVSVHNLPQIRWQVMTCGYSDWAAASCNERDTCLFKAFLIVHSVNAFSIPPRPIAISICCVCKFSRRVHYYITGHKIYVHIWKEKALAVTSLVFVGREKRRDVHLKRQLSIFHWKMNEHQHQHGWARPEQKGLFGHSSNNFSRTIFFNRIQRANTCCQSFFINMQ